MQLEEIKKKYVVTKWKKMFEVTIIEPIVA